MQIIAIATLVASTQAGLLGVPAISTHGLALGPAAIAAPAYTTHAIAAPAYAAPAYAAPAYAAPAYAAPAILKAPTVVKAAPSIDYVVSKRVYKSALILVNSQLFLVRLNLNIYLSKNNTGMGDKLLSFYLNIEKEYYTTIGLITFIFLLSWRVTWIYC